MKRPTGADPRSTLTSPSTVGVNYNGSSPPPFLSSRLGPAPHPMLVRPTTTKVRAPSQYQASYASRLYPFDEFSHASGSHTSGLVSNAPSPPQRNRVPSPCLLTPQARHNMLMQRVSDSTLAPNRYPPQYSNAALNGRHGFAHSTKATFPPQSPSPLSSPTSSRYSNIPAPDPRTSPLQTDSIWATTGNLFSSTPNCSPLTIDGMESPAAWLSTSYGNTRSSASPFGFVPIEDDIHLTDLATPASWVTTNLLSTLSPSALTETDDEEYNHEEELMQMMSMTTERSSNYPSLDRQDVPLSPFVHSSNFKKGTQYQQMETPSPAHTAETASIMTMDQSNYSGNTGAHGNMLDFIVPPPVYPKSIERATPPMSSLAAAAKAGRYVAASPTPSIQSTQTVKVSSLAAALAAGRSSGGTKTLPGVARPQSAPTLGRATLATKAAAASKEEEAQQRKSRLKTELCMHYLQGRPCPFGQSTYRTDPAK
jgi:hypothetical protein